MLVELLHDRRDRARGEADDLARDNELVVLVRCGRLEDVQQVLHGGRHFMNVGFLDESVLRAFGDLLEVRVLHEEPVVLEVDQEGEGVVRLSLRGQWRARLGDAAGPAIRRADRGRSRGHTGAFIEQLGVVEVLGDDETRAVLGELDDPAFVEEDPA